MGRPRLKSFKSFIGILGQRIPWSTLCPDIFLCRMQIIAGKWLRGGDIERSDAALPKLKTSISFKQ